MCEIREPVSLSILCTCYPHLDSAAEFLPLLDSTYGSEEQGHMVVSRFPAKTKTSGKFCTKKVSTQRSIAKKSFAPDFFLSVFFGRKNHGSNFFSGQKKIGQYFFAAKTHIIIYAPVSRPGHGNNDGKPGPEDRTPPPGFFSHRNFFHQKSFRPKTTGQKKFRAGFFGPVIFLVQFRKGRL